MDIATLLSAERTRSNVEVSSKKRLLEMFAALFAETVPELGQDDLFQQLMGREKLGSTGIGEGVAIPHCRARNCTRAYGALLQLSAPLAFDAVDDKPIDLAFALIVPEEAHSDHLNALAAIAEQFQRAEFRHNLRSADDAAELYAIATNENSRSEPA